MFAFSSRTFILAVLATSVLGAPIPQAQNQPAANQQGQPLSVGKAADPSSQASSIFGTTTDAPNYTDSPTGVCIVPALASDAGFGTAKVPLTTEQALQLCPNATRIVVQAQTKKRGAQGAGQTNAQPTGTGTSQPAGSSGNQQGTNGNTPTTGNSGLQNGTNSPQTGSGSGTSQQGQPISVGKAASATAQASTVFGTTTESPNFSTSPTGVCIVPMFANEAGLGSDKTPITNEQALQLCPNAARIVVCTN